MKSKKRATLTPSSLISSSLVHSSSADSGTAKIDSGRGCCQTRRLPTSGKHAPGGRIGTAGSDASGAPDVQAVHCKVGWLEPSSVGTSTNDQTPVDLSVRH